MSPAKSSGGVWYSSLLELVFCSNGCSVKRSVGRSVDLRPCRLLDREVLALRAWRAAARPARPPRPAAAAALRAVWLLEGDWEVGMAGAAHGAVIGGPLSGEELSGRGCLGAEAVAPVPAAAPAASGAAALVSGLTSRSVMCELYGAPVPPGRPEAPLQVPSSVFGEAADLATRGRVGSAAVMVEPELLSRGW